MARGISNGHATRDLLSWVLLGLVVAGLMSLAWMLLLTLAVFVEKVLSQGQRISTVIGVAFVSLGLAVSSGAGPTPWVQS